MTNELGLRPFQEELLAVAPANIQAGKNITVAYIDTGSGKTLAWQLLAHELAKARQIDYVAAYAPRLNLCVQADLDWQEFNIVVGGAALGRVGQAINRDPLLTEDLGGFVSTYQAAVMAPARHRDQAHKGTGRFLLVLDEAQFCGYGENGGGTQAGALMRELIARAYHTVILTGTPYRADREEIVGCEYSAPDANGYRHLLHDVRATYIDGVANGYLRPFEFRVHDGRVRWQSTDGREQRDLVISEEGDDHLRAILRNEDVWVPIVDKALELLRERQAIDTRYRALFTCIDQDHAVAVHRYARDRYPDFGNAIAVSKDGERANATLRAFRETNDHDTLSTCRMAFIGYDHKPITVVGVLTHYRHDGHLRQIVGRGLRMWADRPTDEQTCYVVGPDDPRMAAFAQRMREESDLGLRERTGDGGEGPPPSDEGEVTSADIDAERAVGLHGEINDLAELRRIEEARRVSGARESATTLQAFLQAAAGQSPPPPPRTSDEPRRTHREEDERIRSEVMRIAKRIAGKRLQNGASGGFGEVIRGVLVDAHRIDGLGFSMNGDLQVRADLTTRRETLVSLLEAET